MHSKPEFVDPVIISFVALFEKWLQLLFEKLRKAGNSVWSLAHSVRLVQL